MVMLKDGREADLELFKFDSCPFCVRVLNSIREQGIEGIRLRDTRSEEGAQADLVARGGRGQVPCLFIDGKPLYESSDIVNWLTANVG